MRLHAHCCYFPMRLPAPVGAYHCGSPLTVAPPVPLHAYLLLSVRRPLVLPSGAAPSPPSLLSVRRPLLMSSGATIRPRLPPGPIWVPSGAASIPLMLVSGAALGPLLLTSDRRLVLMSSGATPRPLLTPSGETPRCLSMLSGAYPGSPLVFSVAAPSLCYVFRCGSLPAVGAFGAVFR